MTSKAQELAQYCAGYSAGGFDWARANCCHFAAGWVESIKGSNPMAGLRTTRSKFSAYRLIGRLGGSLRAAWSRLMVRESIPASLAQIGDVVLLPLPDGGAALGICAGRTAVFVLSDGATGHWPMSEAECAWRC